MTQTPAPHDAATDAEQPDQQHPPASAPDRRAVVRVGIALAALLFLAASGVLYLRWATMREPMCVFIVEAPTTLRGAEVTVDGINIAKPHTATIGRGERFAIPFYLEYGTYRVRITMNGAGIGETEVVLSEDDPYQKLDLKDLAPPLPPPATTMSAPRPPVELDAAPGLTSPWSPPSPSPPAGIGTP